MKPRPWEIPADLSDRLVWLADRLDKSLKRAESIQHAGTLPTYELAGFLRDHGTCIVETLRAANREIVPF